MYFNLKDEIGDGSNTLKFSEIAHGFEYGVSAEAIKFDGCNQYIRITDITETGSFNKSKLSSPSKGIEDKYLVRENDILLARTGASVGKSYLYNKDDGKLYFAGFLIRMNITGLNSYYMKSFLDTSKYWNQVNVLSVRSGQPGLNAKEYKNFKMPCVSKYKSDLIGKFLSQIDNLIIKQEEKIKSINILKIKLRKSLFKSTLGIETSIDDLCKITTGKLDANAMEVDGKYRFYTCAKKYYSINSYAFDDDVLLISGNGANVGYIHSYKGKFNAYQRTYVLYSFLCNKNYLNYALKENLPKRIFSTFNGGNTPFITKDVISKMKIKIPKIEEQDKIANILSQMDKFIVVIFTTSIFHIICIL